MKALVAAAWVISQVPTTFSSITVRKPLGVIASAGLRNWPPALFTSVSMRPCCATTSPMNASTASSSRMSRADADAVPPPASISATVTSSGSWRRPQIATVAPSLASSSAVALPSPVPAPETTQTWRSSSPSLKMRDASATRRSLFAARRRSRG